MKNTATLGSVSSGAANAETRRRNLIARLLPALAVLALSLACAAPPPPVHATLSMPTLRIHGESEVTQDGMTISVIPITTENENRETMTWRRFAWTEPSVSNGRVVNTQKAFSTTIMPLPGFKVQISNHTGHVVRFTTALIRLETSPGASVPLFASTAELQAWNEASMGAVGTNPEVNAQLRGFLGTLTLFNRATELMDGDQYTGYLAFNNGTMTYAQHIAWMGNVERLKLRIAEVPTQVDAAGAVSHTSEFDFVFDKVVTPVSVTCPAETQPSLDSCTRG